MPTFWITIWCQWGIASRKEEGVHHCTLCCCQVMGHWQRNWTRLQWHSKWTQEARANVGHVTRTKIIHGHGILPSYIKHREKASKHDPRYFITNIIYQGLMCHCLGCKCRLWVATGPDFIELQWSSIHYSSNIKRLMEQNTSLGMFIWSMWQKQNSDTGRRQNQSNQITVWPAFAWHIIWR